MAEKSYREVALEKSLDLPDSDTGMVQTSYSFTLKGIGKVDSVKELTPTNEELNLINSLGVVKQSKEDWIVLRNIDVLGDRDQFDRQGDKFDPQVERTMAAQAFNTPIILNHDHNINTPAIGMTIKGEITPQGYRESWAIPLVDYNADIIDGMMKGTINKVSIGALYNPALKICLKCDKSIYSSYCPHEPGQVDSNGNLVKILVKDISHYLEKSLVNCPARVGTNVNGRKSMDGEEMSIPSEDNVEIIKSTDTISPVNTIEDNTVAKESEKTEAQIEAEKGVKDQTKPIPLAEATTKSADVPAVEETDEEKAAKALEAEKAVKDEADKLEVEKAAKKKPEPDADDMAKSTKVEYLLADEHVTLLKSVGSTSEDFNTKFNKSVEMHTEQGALIAKQAEQITTLVEMNKALAGQVEKVTKMVEDTASAVKAATETSTEEVLTKLVEIVKAAQEMKQPLVKATAEVSDPWNVLFQ